MQNPFARLKFLFSAFMFWALFLRLRGLEKYSRKRNFSWSGRAQKLLFWILEKNKAGADEDEAFSKICALPESRQLDVADRRKKVFQTENRRCFLFFGSWRKRLGTADNMKDCGTCKDSYAVRDECRAWRGTCRGWLPHGCGNVITGILFSLQTRCLQTCRGLPW